MGINYKLKEPISKTHSVDLDDVWMVKKSLQRSGFYDEPEYGMTPYPDERLFEAIESFQKDQRLYVDGVMMPGGETEQSMRPMLDAALTYRCVHCAAPHGGVHSTKVCWQCRNKGLR